MNPINPVLIGRPNFIPGRDLVDWTDEGPVVKLNVDLEQYEGDIFLKVKHVVQIGRVVGMVPQEELELKDKVIEQLKLKIQELENATGEEVINGKLDSVSDRLSALMAVVDNGFTSLLAGEPEAETEESEAENSADEEEDLFSEKTEKAIGRSLIQGNDH